MTVKVFGIYDSKVEAYLTPFFMRSKGEALRALGIHANDPQHNFCKHAEDFTLFELGTWDESNGKFDVYPAPQSMCVLIELRKDATSDIKAS